MEIKAVTKEDVRACAALFAQVFRGPPWHEEWSGETAETKLREVLETPGCTGLVALSDGAVVGFLLGNTEQRAQGRHFQVKEFCVRPERQRQGIGRALLRQLYQQLAAERIEAVYLLTVRDGPAHQFYEQNGFRPAFRTFVIVTRESPAAYLSLGEQQGEL